MDTLFFFVGIAVGMVVSLPYVGFKVDQSVSKAFNDQRRLIENETRRKPL